MNIKSAFCCLSMPLIIFVGTVSAEGQQPVPCRPRKDADRPAIVCRVGGGLTGAVEEWIVYADGLVCMGSGTEPVSLVLGGSVGPKWTYTEKGKMPPYKVVELVDTVSKLGFFTMKSERYSTGGCNQCRRYQITVRKGAQQRTVEGADWNMPAGLKDIVSKIQRVITTEIP